MNRFSAMYIAALAVIVIGILGTVIVPKAHADGLTDPSVTDVRSAAGKYVWKVTTARLRNHPTAVITSKP